MPQTTTTTTTTISSEDIRKWKAEHPERTTYSPEEIRYWKHRIYGPDICNITSTKYDDVTTFSRGSTKTSRPKWGPKYSR